MQIALFKTCLVSAMRPSVERATTQLLRYAGCEVHIPKSQTCCGQPAWNAGYLNPTQSLAKKLSAEFAEFDYTIVPSGSCCGMIRKHFPAATDNDLHVCQFAEKCYELSTFLSEVCSITLPPSPTPKRISYHDACAGLRELGVKQQPRQLLEQVGHTIVEMEECEACCGFGGTFSVKYGNISSALAADKCQNIVASGCEHVALGDVGCGLNIEGRAHYDNTPLNVWHFAELLAEGLPH